MNSADYELFVQYISRCELLLAGAVDDEPFG